MTILVTFQARGGYGPYASSGSSTVFGGTVVFAGEYCNWKYCGGGMVDISRAGIVGQEMVTNMLLAVRVAHHMRPNNESRVEL